MKALPLPALALLFLSVCGTLPTPAQPPAPAPALPPAAASSPAKAPTPQVASKKTKPKKTAPVPSRPQKESTRSEESVICTETLVI